MNVSELEMEITGSRKLSKYGQRSISNTNFLDMVKTEQDSEEIKPVSVKKLKYGKEDLSKGSYSHILVKPDGSKVLMVTTRVGAMETTMSLKISETTDALHAVMEESVVEAYKKKHPGEAYRVEQQVKSGKRVLSKNHAEHFPREKMSMAAYKQFIMGIIHSIPFHPSRRGDCQIVNISDEGWEQMKKDPEYEAWVLGYLAEDRAVSNPFAGLTGGVSSFSIESFGASIEEHHGQSFSMKKPGNKSSDKKNDRESWWEKRRKRAREYMKEQEKKARIKREVRMEQERELYHQRVWENQQRLEAFLNGNILEMGLQYHNYYHNYISPELLAEAILAYDRRTTTSKK